MFSGGMLFLESWVAVPLPPFPESGKRAAGLTHELLDT
jgi:hypothetical protein